MNGIKKYFIANWKMELDCRQSLVLAKKYFQLLKNVSENNKIIVCPDFVSLKAVDDIFKKTSISLGAQDVFWDNFGPSTGEVALQNLIQVGCHYVILGHSFRCRNLGESPDIVNRKLKFVLKSKKIIPIVCVGEGVDCDTKEKRNNFLLQQIKKIFFDIGSLKQDVLVAYEPAWAIGSGITPEAQELKEINEKIFDFIKQQIKPKDDKKIKIIYGGGVSKETIGKFKGLDLDGFLIGRASLNAAEFKKICSTQF